MTKREVMGRYKGSVFGLVWSFFNPLLMLTVYTFVFSVVFKARWNTGIDSKTGFALALFVGMIVHGLVAESISRAPSLITSNVNYVKKVVFPLEILPWTVMGAALFHTTINLFVWSIFYFVINFSLHWTIVLLPLVFFPLVLFSMGTSWVLASLGVYFRDVNQLISLVVTLLLFLSPVFYPISSIPEKYQPLLYMNPLTLIIEQTRGILISGQIPDWKPWFLSVVLSVIVACLGFAWFQKTRKGFADVL
ncbi:MAG: ABC transporter permease [Gammaproteobacteria bacterium]|nr:ABC transporter permease [Gammaproteobacteria bacterium]